MEDKYVSIITTLLCSVIIMLLVANRSLRKENILLAMICKSMSCDENSYIDEDFVDQEDFDKLGMRVHILESLVMKPKQKRKAPCDQDNKIYETFPLR
jgi:Trp operon repressor